uniref:Uncharacterized protein n=1 Tax=Arundo donax TaxID=35708 RepID=A0A0A8ZZZ4_ARUDO
MLGLYIVWRISYSKEISRTRRW